MLCRFFWTGIRDFSAARQFCAFGNLYQQFFVNRLSNKKYGFCFLSVMRTIQYHQCMDGGGRFSRSVHKNTFRNKAIYASELYCRIFVWCLAHCNAHQKLHKWRNVVSLKGADELQIVRIMAAQIISFAVVFVIHTNRTMNVQ